jgi:glycosyltransferase involved in cell wall biosynthesis
MVAVAPLRIARGVQNKVLEAMAMGRPVVSTRAAFNGIDADPGTEVLLADEADEFAAHVCRLLSDPSLRSRMGQCARQRIESHYRWDVPLAAVDKLVAEITHRRGERASSGRALELPVTAHPQ